MRSHGVPNFPDPVAGPNGITFANIGPNSPQLQRAEQACKSILPPDSGGSQAIPPAQQAAYLKWAACIRAHGLPNFPDPTFAADGLHLDINPQNVQSRTLLASALRPCNHDLAGVPGGSPISVGGNG